MPVIAARHAWTTLALTMTGIACLAGTACNSGTDDAGGQPAAKVTPADPTAHEGSSVRRVDVRRRIVAAPLVYGNGRFGYYAVLRLDRALPVLRGAAYERGRYHVVINGEESDPLRPYPGRSADSACYRAAVEVRSIHGARAGDRMAAAVIDFGRSGNAATRITNRRLTVLRNPFVDADFSSASVKRFVRHWVDDMGCSPSQ